MLHHYITKYEENGKRYAEAWLQLNLFGWCWCFSKRKKELGDAGMLDGIDRITVENTMTGEVYATITESEISTASSNIVVRLEQIHD